MLQFIIRGIHSDLPGIKFTRQSFPFKQGTFLFCPFDPVKRNLILQPDIMFSIFRKAKETGIRSFLDQSLYLLLRCHLSHDGLIFLNNSRTLQIMECIRNFFLSTNVHTQ